MTFERHRINRRVIDDLKTRSTVGMYFYVAVTAAVLTVEGFYKRHLLFSIVFLCVMVVIATFRILQHKFYDRFDQINKKLNFCAFFTSVYATALTWGTGFAYFMVMPEELTSKMIMLASTVGLDSVAADVCHLQPAHADARGPDNALPPDPTHHCFSGLPVYRLHDTGRLQGEPGILGCP